ncbi:PREDICTED: uncharacterized protein LOC105965402 [Erythranthe guttata]|uniref:uncharacterized protein LOC105965402 n=1 Tax=Erythranthe guttata TaxID=4155 RepID=UPI00064DDFAB|nr:PREDICTED: uncharacterized protein LOC105965402 [Erythranthe guttata]|eukprot:XP_012845398.1 PREDICTED: uncharacterized protein LOC105965402 [Erythranthe guttata]
MPNDDIFVTEKAPAVESKGPDVNVEELWSDCEDPENPEELRSTDSEGEKSDEFNEVTGMKNPNLFVGLKFSTPQVFRRAMIRWNVLRGHDITYIKNENKKITAKCKEDCGWRIHASPIVEEYLDDLRDNGEMKVNSMKRKVRKDLNVEVSRWQCYRAKNKAKKIVKGDIQKQFALLRDYCATSGYLAACRPIVGLDGCFLKGAVGGQLLSAICRDGNDNLFPLAIVVVESECKQTWTWFVIQFLRDMGEVQERGWVFISGRQKGLVETMNELMPGVEHRYCIRHMYANFKQKYKGKELKDLFWKAASTANLNDWKYYMDEIKKVDPPTVVNGEESSCAFQWLMKANPENWARSHFSPSAKCDILVNNMNESWNNYIIDARDMHIISMLEWIRKSLMVRFQVKRTGMLKHEGKIGPNIFKKLERIKQASANCFPTWSGGMVFEVECHEGPNIRQCSVNLETRTCTCRMWDVSGIPCKHVVSAIYLNKHQPEDYVHSCYTRDAYLATYNFQVFPVPGEHDYLKSGLPQLLPPVIKKQAGRPKKKRNKTADEQETRKADPTKVSRRNLPVTCARCLKVGHNKRGCKGEMHPNSKLHKNSFAPSPSMQQSSVPNSSSSQQPHVSQSTFENPFSQKPASQPALLHGPNGALFQRSKTTRVDGSKSTAVGGSKRTASYFYF